MALGTNTRVNNLDLNDGGGHYGSKNIAGFYQTYDSQQKKRKAGNKMSLLT
jgi:hypothetical protein